MRYGVIYVTGKGRHPKFYDPETHKSYPIKPPGLPKDKDRQKATKADYADRKKAKTVKSVVLTPLDKKELHMT